MPRKYTLEFKAEAVKLVTEQGYSQNKAAEVLGTHSKNVNRWVKESTNKVSTDKNIPSEQEEIRQLRKENERLRMEREILKKAAAFFASEKL
jgi:transposase